MFLLPCLKLFLSLFGQSLDCQLKLFWVKRAPCVVVETVTWILDNVQCF